MYSNLLRVIYIMCTKSYKMVTCALQEYTCLCVADKSDHARKVAFRNGVHVLLYTCIHIYKSTIIQVYFPYAFLVEHRTIYHDNGKAVKAVLYPAVYSRLHCYGCISE